MGIGMVYVLSIPPAVLVCQDLWTLLANKHNSGSDIFLHFKCIINYQPANLVPGGFEPKNQFTKGMKVRGLMGAQQLSVFFLQWQLDLASMV